MPRRKCFHSTKLSQSERAAIRLLCAELVRESRTPVGREQLAHRFSPIEPRVLPPLLADIADGTGYGKSPLSLTTDRKAYYLRKNHVYYCIFSHMQADLYRHLKGVITNG